MTDILTRIPVVRTGEQFVSTQPHGYRVKDPSPFNLPDPNYCYLIYITRVNNDLLAWHMQKSVQVDPDTTANELFEDIKNNDITFKVGENLIDIRWSYPCFVYVVFDLDSVRFIDDDAIEHDPILFVESKPIRGSSPTVYLHYDPNYSFFNGLFRPLGNRTAFRCTNYLTDERGNPIYYPKRRLYGYEIRYEEDIGSGSNVTYTDPDGQNQGPPHLPAIPIL